MIKYHGTPITGSRVGVVDFVRKRHCLIPFNSAEDLPLVAAECESFCIDNGAYNAWKAGGKINYDAFKAFVEVWHKHPRYDYSFIPDVIGGSEDENNEYIKMWPAHLKGVPIFHLDESLKRAEWMAHSFEWIALGASVQHRQPGKGGWWKRMAEVMDVICDKDGRPYCRIHGLKILDPRIFTLLPLKAGDSANATRNACMVKDFGMYAPATPGQRAAVIANRIEAHNSAAVWNRERVVQLDLF